MVLPPYRFRVKTTEFQKQIDYPTASRSRYLLPLRASHNLEALIDTSPTIIQHIDPRRLDRFTFCRSKKQICWKKPSQVDEMGEDWIEALENWESHVSSLDSLVQ